MSHTFPKSLRLPHDVRKIYDIEYQSKPALYLKGVGRLCEVCGNHIIGRSNKKTCSDKCRYRKSNVKRYRDNKQLIGLHSFIILKKHGAKNYYRIAKIYLKRGVIEEVKITPESKELWAFLEKIDDYRNKPMEITNV